MSVQPEDPGYCIRTHIADRLASASSSAKLDKKLSGAKDILTGFFKVRVGRFSTATDQASSSWRSIPVY